MINSLLPLDGDGNAVWDYVVVKKTITFVGGTANAIGDHDGTGDPFDIFSVTGLIRARIFGFCTTDLVGAATLEVGTAKDVNGIIAQVADTTAIDVNEIWHDATPDNSVELLSVAPENIIGQDVIGTVGTANITAGVIDFYCLWKPLSPDANVT
jgi:hypothetical protein